MLEAELARDGGISVDAHLLLAEASAGRPASIGNIGIPYVNFDKIDIRPIKWAEWI